MSKIKTNTDELNMTEELVDNLDQQIDNKTDLEGRNRFVIYNFDF